ncbi:hypothetical protein A8139_02590 [Marinomonas primoryensis]|uniref:Uncharacterized protein n=1 Tax=Marinomonas primoryensis TaxID=178399 RepID=A0A2Z4PNJ3_9GAMM|nr:hypothetical protein A8139_02590 [Marinomonas primoryensis]
MYCCLQAMHERALNLLFLKIYKMQTTGYFFICVCVIEIKSNFYSVLFSSLKLNVLYKISIDFFILSVVKMNT